MSSGTKCVYPNQWEEYLGMDNLTANNKEDRSLQTVMNEMAQRIDTLLPAEKNSRLSHEQKIAEIQVYRTIDPLLSDLCKEYEDIKEQHKTLLKLNGKDDPMCEIAADMLESACSAVDTRMIELKEDKKIVARAALRRQKMLEEEKLAEEQAKQARLKRQTEFWQKNKREQKTEAEKTDPAEVMLACFLLYLITKWNKAAFEFSPMRRDFVQAV